MSRIEVLPAALEDLAARLRATDVVTRRARRALTSAQCGVTGSVELTAALSEHADRWEWCLDRLHDRLLGAARALTEAARVYEQVEHSVVTTPTTHGQAQDSWRPPHDRGITNREPGITVPGGGTSRAYGRTPP